MDYFNGLNEKMDELEGLTVKISSYLGELKSNINDFVELNESSILLDKYLNKINF